MNKLIFIAGLIIAISGCKNGPDYSLPTEKAEVTDVKLIPPPPSDQADDKRVGAGYENAGDNNTVTDTSKKIIKQGTIVFESDDLAATHKEIIGALKKLGGYVEEDNETTNNDENRKEYNLKIRVPAKNFDFMLDSVSSSAYKIDSKNISIVDATAQYIDMQSRLNNKKALEKRYIELLAKADKISDMLEIESKLTDIRSDIDSAQGQLNYLSKQVAYSSLEITFYTKQPTQIDTGDGAAYKFKKALADGWMGLQDMFFGLISIWPGILLVMAFIWLIRIWRKRRKLKKSQ